MSHTEAWSLRQPAEQILLPAEAFDTAEEKEEKKTPMQLRLENHKRAAHNVHIHMAATVFTAIFGAIYEYFSFGVYSFYMIYAFLIPLLFGVLPWLYMAEHSSSRKGYPPRLSVNLSNAGIATLTVGAIFRGILEIYGTTSVYSRYYMVMGAFLLLAGAMSILGYREKEEGSRRVE